MKSNKVLMINVCRELVCSHCGETTKNSRHSLGKRKIRSLNETELHIVYSKHRCEHCGRIFNNPDVTALYGKYNRYSSGTKNMAVTLSREGFSYLDIGYKFSKESPISA